MLYDPFKYLEEIRKEELERATMGLKIKRESEWELISLVEKLRSY